MLARKIAYNTVISVAARIAGTLLTFITVGLITRYLSRSEWGEYSIILTFGGIITVLAEFGLYQFLIREISQEGADEIKISSNVFTLRLFFSFFIFLAASLMGLVFPYSHQVKMGIFVGMGGFWFLSCGQVLMGVFQKYLRMDKIGLVDLAGRVVQLIVVFLFIKMGFGFLYIVAALSAGALANFILVYWLAKKQIFLKLSFDFKFWKKSLVESCPLAVSSILTMVYFSSDSLFLSFLRPAVDVGIYRLPYKILESLIFFPAMFVGLVMPILSKAVNSEKNHFKFVFQKSYDVLLVFAIPLVFGTFIASPKIIYLLGGNLYPESVAVLNILILAVSIIFLGTIFSFVLIAMRRQKSLLWISLAGAVFNVSANLIFIPKYSYYAAAVITVATEALVTVLMAVVIFRACCFFPSSKIAAKSALASFLMMLVLYWMKNQNLFLSVSFGIVVYFGWLFLFKGFSTQEISELIKKDENRLL